MENLGSEQRSEKGEREYTSVWSCQDVPLIQVEVLYHGKQPDLPFNAPGPSYDWKVRDTDFYGLKLTNLTDLPIRLKQVRIELDRGEDSRTHGESYLTERLGSSVIQPGEFLVHKNTWIWAKGTQNRMRKSFFAEVEPADGSRIPELQALLKGKGNEGYSFNFQVTQHYKR